MITDTLGEPTPDDLREMLALHEKVKASGWYGRDAAIFTKKMTTHAAHMIECAMMVEAAKDIASVEWPDDDMEVTFHDGERPIACHGTSVPDCLRQYIQRKDGE